MATTESSKPAAKQLGELLKQQQEPFVLQIYLSEKGCSRKKMNKKKGISNFPKLLKVVVSNKLVFGIKGLKIKNCDYENGKVSVTEMKRNEQETAEPDRFSAARSCTTVYNPCADSGIDEPSVIKKAVADSKFPWSCSIEDSKEERSPARQKSLFLSKLIMEDSILSASLWNLLLQTKPDKPSCVRELEEADGSNSRPFSVSKGVLQQGRKLEEEGWKMKYGDGLLNNVKMVESDVMDIGVVVGNAIAEEIIKEVVEDMIFMFRS